MLCGRNRGSDRPGAEQGVGQGGQKSIEREAGILQEVEGEGVGVKDGKWVPQRGRH